MFNNIKKLFEYLNEKGFPIPMARYNKSPSVSLSLLVLSAAFVMVAALSEDLGLKVSFWECLAWHISSAVLYYNRSAKITKDGFELSSSKEQDGKEGLDTGREKSDDNGVVQK